ncbi:MAG: hypothetical protein KGQ60_07655, partial [Planctomycetes bacterium]|nr:hypothetical protein [Planctomycetota bacterium]
SCYTNRPTPQNVGLFAFLALVFVVFREFLTSQTLPIATTLRLPARHQLGLISLPPLGTLPSLKVARPGVMEMSLTP